MNYVVRKSDDCNVRGHGMLNDSYCITCRPEHESLEAISAIVYNLEMAEDLCNYLNNCMTDYAPNKKEGK